MITSLVKFVGSVRDLPSTSQNSFNSSAEGSSPNSSRYATRSKPNSFLPICLISVLTLYPRYQSCPSQGIFLLSSSTKDTSFEMFVNPVRTPLPFKSLSPRLTPYSANSESLIVSCSIQSCLFFSAYALKSFFRIFHLLSAHYSFYFTISQKKMEVFSVN